MKDCDSRRATECERDSIKRYQKDMKKEREEREKKEEKWLKSQKQEPHTTIKHSLIVFVRA